MIAYCKKDAQAAFAKLAAVLEKTAEAEIAEGQPIGNADVLNTIERIIEADPVANPIRSEFEKAWDIAALAGDAETERELRTRYADLVADFKAIADGGETDKGATYQRHLRSHAAWIRAICKKDENPPLEETDNAKILERLEPTIEQVKFLYNDRKDKIKKNQEQGKTNQEIANTDEVQRAARDKEKALKRVHDRVTRGETNVNNVCKSVSRRFKPLTTKKNPNGDFEEYEPLMTARGKPMKPETLAKYYRETYGTKRKRKANATKNQARTQAARNAKAARSKRKR